MHLILKRKHSGGGVCVEGSNFTMNDGEISGNKDVLRGMFICLEHYGFRRFMVSVEFLNHVLTKIYCAI